MKHFDEIKNLAIDCISEINDMTSSYYIVRDVFGKISVYIIGKIDSNELENKIRNLLGEIWLNRVIKIEESDFLYAEVSKNAVKIKDNIFYSERPLVKRTWNTINRNTGSDKAKVITFYSYKGGVGRTTTLAMTALQLVREGKKIVVVDLDLEAPGLSTILKPEMEYPKYGVVDFLIESETCKEGLDINEYVYAVNNKKLIGLTGGELLVMQAANLQNGEVEEYYNKLSRVDFNMPKYLNDQNAITNLLKYLKNEYQPDFIFIDSRAGIHDIGALTLLRYSDEVVPVFYGNEQNMLGLKFIMPKLVNFDIPFYLINSPMPVSEEEAEVELKCYLKSSFEILEEAGYFIDIPEIFDESSPHYPLNIKYDALNANINSDDKILQILNLNGEDNVYKLLSNKLSSNNEEIVVDEFKESASRLEMLDSIQKITSEVAAAENEFSDLPSLMKNFYPLKEYRYIFDKNKFIVTGAKGSGKTALFNVLKCPEYAHRLAKYVEVKSDFIDQTKWITGLDSRGNFPSQANFRAISNAEKRGFYSVFWKIMAVKVLQEIIKSDLKEYPNYLDEIFDCKYSQIKEIISRDTSIDEKLSEFFSDLDSMLMSKNKTVIITYDALDYCIETDLRSVFISELINLWAEMNIRLRNIKSKIFLREDIYINEVSGITDKIKLNNYRTLIDWDYDHLLAIVWKRMLESNTTLKMVVEKTLLKNGYSLVCSEDVGLIPMPNSDINKLILGEIIGDKMGKGNKAYTYNWISYRLSDTNDNIVPRSILKLFSLAAKNEIIEGKQDILKLITPRALENSVNEVSKDRVVDMSEEYPEYRNVFLLLKNFCPTFPVEEEILKDGLKQCGIDEAELKTSIDRLKDIGILKEYQRKKSDPIRYHIPDIYLKGMGLVRKGYR